MRNKKIIALTVLFMFLLSSVCMAYETVFYTKPLPKNVSVWVKPAPSPSGQNFVLIGDGETFWVTSPSYYNHKVSDSLTCWMKNNKHYFYNKRLKCTFTAEVRVLAPDLPKDSFQPDLDRWSRLTSDNDVFFYYDKQTISYKNQGNTCDVWIMCIDNKDGTNSKSHETITKARKIAILSLTVYDSKTGAVLFSDTPEKPKYYDIIPGSLGEAIYEQLFYGK